MSTNPKVYIAGNTGEYCGIGYTVRAVGEELTIEYHADNLTEDSLVKSIDTATAIAKQIKELVK